MSALPAFQTETAPAPHLLHVFPTFEVGGVPLRMATIVAALGGRYRHTVVSLDDRFGAATRIPETVDAVCRTIDPAVRAGRGRFAAIDRAIREIGPDLLLTYNWGAIEWALVNGLRRRCPRIHLESGFGPEEADALLARRTWFRRFALRPVDRLIVPSTTLVEIARRHWKVPAQRIVHIPNGVDCDRYGRPPDRTALPGLDRFSGATVVGTLAPLRAEKNIGLLVEAFARLEAPAVLVIVGDGPERAGLEARAAALGLADRVLFAGHSDRPEAVIGLIDVFVLSSDTEQMPNTIIQAMAAGRAIASVDVGDVRAMIAPENHAFLAPKRDSAALARAIDALVTDPALRAAIGTANRTRVRAHFSLERMVSTYDRVFEDVLAGRAAAALDAVGPP